MKIIYDNETDSIYVRFSEDTVVESEEKQDGTIVDYNDKNETVAVEILNGYRPKLCVNAKIPTKEKEKKEKHEHNYQ